MGTTPLKAVDSVVAGCNVCAALGEAPHPPVAAASLVSAFDEKVQVNLSFLDNLIALHAIWRPGRTRWRFGMRPRRRG